jgi:integrase
MPKKAAELTALHVKRIRRPGLHAVGGVDGLQMQVKDSGARSWILRVKVGTRRRDIGLGGFPDVTLEQARGRAREAREQLRQGIDPLAARRAAKEALRAADLRNITFDDAAKFCHEKKRPEFSNVKHGKDWINSLAAHVSPTMGKVRIAEVGMAHVIAALKPIWTTKTETATRVRQRIEDVLDWATVNGYRSGPNPAAWDGNLEHALPRPSRVRKVEHHAAIPWQEVGAFMAELRKREGMGARALEFAILTAARSGEVRLAQWDEIDLAAKLWTVPAARMKARKPHRVPLSDAAIKLLESLPRMEGSNYVFPAVKGGALSDMSLSAVTRRMAVPAVPHGFRSSFKDWCRSSTSFADEVSELALAHVNDDATRAAYARDELLPKRALLMRDWAKYCATVPAKATVTKLAQPAAGGVGR